jgi:hypothetical protein
MNEAWFAQNLELTYTFFQNNVSKDLWMKVSKTDEGYSTGEKGGPLFFILMMNHLLSDTEEAASSCEEGQDFQVNKVVGEDISKAVSLLCGAINWLTSIHKLPDDIVKIFLQVFQTTSSEEFNLTFNLLKKQCKHSAVLRQTGPSIGITTTNIFTMAESKYRNMLQDNKWSRVTTTGDVAFHAGMGKDHFKPKCLWRFLTPCQRMYQAP